MEKSRGTERGDKNKWNGSASRGAQIRRLDRVGLYDIRVLWLHDSRGRKRFYVAVLCNCGWRHLEVNIFLVLDAELQEYPLIGLRHEGEKVKLRCSKRCCWRLHSYQLCRWANTSQCLEGAAILRNVRQYSPTNTPSHPTRMGCSKSLLSFINPLTPNDSYRGCTALLTSKFAYFTHTSGMAHFWTKNLARYFRKCK